MAVSAKEVLLLVALVSLTCAQNITSCLSDEDCSPSIHNVESAGICNVTSGLCSCNTTLPSDCFHIYNNTCAPTRCGVFDNTTSSCRAGPKSRTTALLLSIFLINFGAANFYIEQYGLAIPQIIIGLLLCVFQFGSCAAACARSEKDKTSIPCVICCSINTFLSLLIFVWWLADLIIFALNTRTDREDCPLFIS